MPFILTNAAQTFQRFIDQVLRGLPFSFAYLDDILVASHYAAEHLEHQQKVFARLQGHGLQIHPAKCILGVPSLDFLGFHLDQHGIRPIDNKVQVIRNFPLLTTQCRLRQFLRLVNSITISYPAVSRFSSPYMTSLRHLLKAMPTSHGRMVPLLPFRTAKRPLLLAACWSTLSWMPRPASHRCI